MQEINHMTSLDRIAAQRGAVDNQRAVQVANAPINRKVWMLLLAVFMSMTGLVAQAQSGGTTDCVIASNDGRNGFRTDEISRCRIDTATGNAAFVFKGKNRQRSYAAFEPLTTRHLEAASYWLNRVGRLRIPANTNPAGFDLQAFLSAASQATHGFVLTRNKHNGRQAMNVVFVTDGVYRSIDFPGTNLRDMPSGFLTTR
ncbi:MAG: hypothetical protein KC448_12420 [Yoonia sp.]|nr:hypothetical protein [Yoonia sp.]